MSKTIWLRNETKKNEQRAALTPINAAKLIKAGNRVIVEKSIERIFSHDEYLSVGCEIVEQDSWKDSSLENCYILGLKELPLDQSPLTHKHIYFAHIYKGQEDASEVFEQYEKGNGTLFDLEFLLNKEGRRIAAFGYWAGYVGAAISIEAYCHQSHDMQPPTLKHYKSKKEWISILTKKLEGLKSPSIIIVGARGRVGAGAQALLNDLNCKDQTLWDFEETKKGGPFSEIIEHDIFINSVLMIKKIAPFLDTELIKRNDQLKIIGDISCDPNSKLNPIPIYDQHTTWKNISLAVKESKTPLSVIAIDNLPSALPRESSQDFSDQLLPYLLDLCKDGEESFTWKNAKEVFNEKKRATK